ncbi:hypothetical protein ACVBEQ_00655 [Nakamurella sp. GG22]
MIGPQPQPFARILLAVVIRVLPAASRDRYREEFRAELAELSWSSQVFQAGTLLVGSFSLRKALRQVDVIDDLTVTKSWRCRLRLHHYLPVQDDNPEMRGRAYLRCDRCGKPKDPPEYGAPPPTGMAFNGTVGGGG